MYKRNRNDRIYVAIFGSHSASKPYPHPPVNFQNKICSDFSLYDDHGILVFEFIIRKMEVATDQDYTVRMRMTTYPPKPQQRLYVKAWKENRRCLFSFMLVMC